MIFQTFLTSLSQFYWSPWFWLPENVKWAQLNPQSGKRFANVSDVYAAIISAVSLLAIRFFLERLLCKPIGSFLGITEAHKKLTKFSECGWRFVYYTVSATIGICVLWDKPWIWDVKEIWRGAPLQTLPSDVWWYCWICAGYYLGCLITVFTDVKKKDFRVMLGHHIVTLVIMHLMWLTNLTRIGATFLILHDVSDPFLEFAKICNYARYPKMATRVFVLYVLIWIATRLVWYVVLLYSMLFQASTLMPLSPAFYVIVFVAMTLFGIHLYWTNLLWKIARQSSNDEVRDDRSSDEEDDDEGNGSEEKDD
ncbi:Ceramide synthase hyl-1 [Orchesella cincta]|uniref:Ceramide synthase hyl-1 n=1 Tax=Orchesella cincta TaxID=48709 RepID=A0A1D2M2L2_ORCCI|nr:Ceramide synthase hyl-1 [Orchesella cincta]